MFLTAKTKRSSTFSFTSKLRTVVGLSDPRLCFNVPTCFMNTLQVILSKSLHYNIWVAKLSVELYLHNSPPRTRFRLPELFLDPEWNISFGFDEMLLIVTEYFLTEIWGGSRNTWPEEKQIISFQRVQGLKEDMWVGDDGKYSYFRSILEDTYKKS